MGSPFAYLVDTLFGLYTVALLLRFLLQLVRANFYNPVSRALVQITDPVLQPLRRLVPGAGGVDIASLVAMVLVQLAGTWLVFLLIDQEITAPALLSMTVYQLVDLVLLTYIVTIVIQALMSWINPGVHSPAMSLLYQLNAPLLRVAQRVTPPLGGLDLSSLLVLIALQFSRLLLKQLF